jgi:hypothetical protein
MSVLRTLSYVVVVVPMFWATSGYIRLHYNGVASCDLQATSGEACDAWMGGQKTQAFPIVSQFSPLHSLPASSRRTQWPKRKPRLIRAGLGLGAVAMSYP